MGERFIYLLFRESLNEVDTEAIRLQVEEEFFLPILTFVFGEAQLGGRVGIVSLARLRQEFYGLPPHPALLHRRLIKEIKHELGHTFGLIHCSQRECVMSVAHNVLAVDQKGMNLCRGCKDFLLKVLKR